MAKKKRYDKWEISNATDALIQAEEIKEDKGKMAAVRRDVDRRAKAIDDIQEFTKGKVK